MDILSPSLLWINNRCYRINPGQENTAIEANPTAALDSRNPYVEEGKRIHSKTKQKTKFN